MGKQLVRMRPTCGWVGAESGLAIVSKEVFTRKEEAGQARICDRSAPDGDRAGTYLEEISLSADLRAARGVIDTTLYSRSLASASSTCSSILSL